MEKNEQYQLWLRNNPSLLWIYGGPGKGKTMLSIYLTQQLELDRNGNAIYFFCSSAHPTRNTATAVIRTLLWMLIGNQATLARLVEPYRDPPERMEALLSTQGSLWELFCKCIRSKELGNTYCLIDGLDECDDTSARWLAAQLAALAQEYQDVRMRLLVSSRAMIEFRHVAQIHLDPDNDHNIGADVERFASAGVSELSRRLHLTDEFSSRIKLDLVRKSDGTFLWVGYAMKELMSKRTRVEVQDAVEDLPVVLPALYSRMLRGVAFGKRETITTMLKWVTVACRPLTPRELAAAIIGQTAQQMDRVQYARDLLTTCEPFVSVRKDVVVFVHQSAKDYLLRTGTDAYDTVESIRIATDDAHLSLAKSCLAALQTPSEMTSYASSYWAHHLGRCRDHDQSSVIRRDLFFSKTSAVRQAWWHTHSSDKARSLRFSYGIRSTECPPLFHLACYLGLQVWAQMLMDRNLILEKLQSGLIHSRMKTTAYTPLHYTLFGQANPRMLRFILVNGADPTLVDRWGRDSISLSLYCGDVKSAELLLDSLKVCKPLRPHLCYRLGAILAMAIWLNATSVAELCLDLGASSNQSIMLSNDQYTMKRFSWVKKSTTSGTEFRLLDFAIELGSEEIFNLLLRHGAAVRVASDQLLSSQLLLALRCGHLHFAQTLVARGALPHGVASSTRLLWVCIREASVCGVDFAFQHGADANVVLGGPLGGLTGLHWTVIEWRRGEYSPLVRAAYAIIVRRLLAHGADPEFRDRRGKTAMDYAAAERAVFEPLSRLIKESQDTADGAAIVDRGSPKPDLQLLKTGGTRSRPPQIPWRPGLRRKSSDTP
jgi:hypothetical protein